ncbi:5'-nucleotidase C-terminal domain-containing protein [Hyalangium gracile]|uniref:5'-nucleotidase C-terminal domain-containing protein n=1 Tax=Hyalangium gracile TaxID=394092 RepID=UPI001CCFC24D|nr:5'-nucleotidase [Hyalangium gracile]
MNRPLLTALVAAMLAPGLGCLAYNDPCQPLVDDPDAVLGFLGEDVYIDKPFARHDNNALGQLAADSYQHAEDDSAAPAQLGIVNGGSIRAEGLCINRTMLPKGALTDGVLHEVFLFENQVVTVNLTEKEVVDMFERSAGELVPAGQPITSPSGGFLHVSESTTLRVDCEYPRGQRVRALTIGGNPVVLPPRTDASRQYRVAMPSFLINGGDGYGAIFGNAGKDPARNPAQSRKLGGVDSNIVAGYMRTSYATEARPLREAQRIIFENCAQPTRPSR